MLNKILSYIYPITRKLHSNINGNIEITYINGKKVLDSENANYSYGSLQKVMHFALQKIDITHINSILILGLGGGSVIETLRKHFYFKGCITAIDIDPIMIHIAANEYGICSNKNTQILCEDASIYMSYCSTNFDLIIIDLFVDTTIPQQFLEATFWNQILEHISPEGIILFNTLCEPSIDTTQIEYLLYKNNFDLCIYNKVKGSNRLLISKKN